MIRTLFIVAIAIAFAVTCATPAFAQTRPASQPATQPGAPEAPGAPGALPADAGNAANVLRDSPRHGEWVDVALPGSKVKIKTFVVYPERQDKAPVVLVIHEIFGLTDWVRAVADQFAAEGFIAVAPDLLSGMGPDGGGTESLGKDVRRTIRKLTHEQVASRLNAVRDYAIKLPAATDKTACVGFCWGGSASFNYAARQPKLRAAAVYYGTAPQDAKLLGNIQCPVLGLYGGDDARVTSTVAPTTAQMKKLKKPYTPHVYSGAGHGFLRQQSRHDGANRAAAQKAWAQTLALFRDRLEEKKAPPADQ